MGASLDQSAHRPALQQPRKAAGNVGIVPAYFIGHQEAGGCSPLTGRAQTVFRFEKHGAGMWRKGAYHNGFEFLKLFTRDRLFLDSEFSREQAPQRIALINGQRTNDPAGIRDGFESLAFARRQLHLESSVRRLLAVRSC